MARNTSRNRSRSEYRAFSEVASGTGRFGMGVGHSCARPLIAHGTGRDWHKAKHRERAEAASGMGRLAAGHSLQNSWFGSLYPWAGLGASRASAPIALHTGRDRPEAKLCEHAKAASVMGRGRSHAIRNAASEYAARASFVEVDTEASAPDELALPALEEGMTTGHIRSRT